MLPQNQIQWLISTVATAMVFRKQVKELIPHELRRVISLQISNFISNSQITLIIREFDGLTRNKLFEAAEIYMATLITANSSSSKRFLITLPEKDEKIKFVVEKNEELGDSFNGFWVRWKMGSMPSQKPKKESSHSKHSEPPRQFELRFHKKHKDMVFDEYLPYVLNKSKAAKEENTAPKLFALKSGSFYKYDGDEGRLMKSLNLNHPSTFDTLAMDVDLKRDIIEDLERFVRSKEFYKRIGKVWKRGYLLHGPPGTGKTSLIAAMANYLKFDVYDLELADITCNSDLRKLMFMTTNRSIIVVEDIDCSIELRDRRSMVGPPMAINSDQKIPKRVPQVTLSGLLNFIDGLWSTCGDERIIIFTTNHTDRLDPALIRPGRMDRHIHLSYCTPCGFKMIASNYLRITEHPLFLEVEELIETAKVTPAEVGEQLLEADEPEIALRRLTKFLTEKKESEERK